MERATSNKSTRRLKGAIFGVLICIPVFLLLKHSFDYRGPSGEVLRLVDDVRDPFMWEWRLRMYSKLPSKVFLRLDNSKEIYQRRGRAINALSTNEWMAAEIRPVVLKLLEPNDPMNRLAVTVFSRFAVEDEQIMNAWLSGFATNFPYGHLAGLSLAAKDAPFREPIISKIASLTNSLDERVRLSTAIALERLDSRFQGMECRVRLLDLEQQLSENLPQPHIVATVHDIGELGPRAQSAVPRLVELCSDENERVRRSATNALLKIQR